MVEFSTYESSSCTVWSSLFISGTGQKEYHLIMRPDCGGGFPEQYFALRKALGEFIEGEGSVRPIFMRWFLSDASNQLALVEDEDCAVSVIEQPPLDGTKVALWVWLAEDVLPELDKDGMWTADFCGVQHIWTSGNCSSDGDSESQMREIFNSYSEKLNSRGMSLKDNCLRTWLFVQNIDVNYAGVVKGRREYFENEGLTTDSHYIASTGIAGRVADPAVRVVMDAYSVNGVSEESIRFLKAPSHMNPTHEYGVTFERGTAVNYSDRKHVFISGTASINNKGEVVHPGDVGRQCIRMIENIKALLQEAECSYDDVMQMLVYLRDISDYGTVSKLVKERFPEHPIVFLWAPVCRSGWLVEMECMAASPIS